MLFSYVGVQAILRDGRVKPEVVPREHVQSRHGGLEEGPPAVEVRGVVRGPRRDVVEQHNAGGEVDAPHRVAAERSLEGFLLFVGAVVVPGADHLRRRLREAQVVEEQHLRTGTGSNASDARSHITNYTHTLSATPQDTSKNTKNAFRPPSSLPATLPPASVPTMFPGGKSLRKRAVRMAQAAGQEIVITCAGSR